MAGSPSGSKQRYEAALARPPVRALFEQLGPGQRDDEDRGILRPFEEVVDEVQKARVGEVKVLEDHDHGTGRGQSFEERPPAAEELLRCETGLDAQQRQEGGLDPAPFVCVRDDPGHGLGEPGSGDRRTVGLEQAGPGADHLAERPEGDSIAVGG